MKDKKHIDRLFQEKLKDFEATPSDSVWENISSELQVSAKDRKGIPVWWKVAGVAAGLLLLFTLGQMMLEDNVDSPIENIVDTNSENEILSNEKNEDSKDVVNDATSDDINIANEESVVSEDLKPESSTSPNNSLINSTQKQNQIYNSNNKDKFNTATANIKNENLDTSSDTGKTIVTEDSNKTELAASENNNSNSTNDNSLNNSIDVEKANGILNAENQSTETVATNSDSVNKIENSEENSELNILGTISEEEKLSVAEEVAANEEDEEVEDSPEESFKRWNVAPNVAPVYFNSLGNGSSIHPEFVNNSKTGDINMSYGITGSYAINKKLSIRAGIHKVNLGYSTNNVVVYNNIEEPINTPLLKLYKNIEMTEEAKGLSFISVSEFNFAQVPGPVNDFIRSSIDQKLGFVEIPLELKYNVSNKKLNVNLIGGFSALFLSENEIYSVDNGNSILLGKATNINSTSFSANFGLGFDFKMSDKLSLNLEPVLKYQLNTFNNTSGNFKPYFIGVYSGLSFKF